MKVPVTVFFIFFIVTANPKNALSTQVRTHFVLQCLFVYSLLATSMHSPQLQYHTALISWY